MRIRAASAVRFIPVAYVSAFAGGAKWRRVRDSNPRTVALPPFTDLQSAAFDLSANPPKLKARASVIGLATDTLAFALFAIT